MDPAYLVLAEPRPSPGKEMRPPREADIRTCADLPPASYAKMEAV